MLLVFAFENIRKRNKKVIFGLDPKIQAALLWILAKVKSMTHFFSSVILGLDPRIHVRITIPTDNSVRTAVLPHWVSLCLNLKFVPQARFQIAIWILATSASMTKGG